VKVEERRYPVYTPKVPRMWWMQTGPFRRFMARELTSVFVAAFSVVMLLFLFAISRGREAYEAFLRWLDLPGIMAFHAVILAAVLYHTITSILAVPTLQAPPRVGRKTVPPRVMVLGALGAWIVASGVVAYFHIWFS
jgi:succinate dehydrogenase subunit C